MGETTIIVGGSHGGVQVASSLRELGYAGAILLISDEPHLPYHRPPLSKSLFDADSSEGQVLRPRSFYESKGIELRLGNRVESIDVSGRAIWLADGRALGFDALVLATGARPRSLPVPGVTLKNVLMLRSLPDARQLAASLGAANDVVVLGAGMIGLEFAAVAARSGRKTTVVDAASRPLLRAVSAEMAEDLRTLHEAHGVKFLFNDGIGAITGKGSVSGVTTSSGVQIKADLVLVAAGVVPNVELAAQAGLAVDNGILVDAHLQTSAPGIYALGDCAAVPTLAGGRIRLESVQNATDQARTAAASITGKREPFDKVPWFWSDQYDAKLQIAGLWTGYDRAVRREVADGKGFAYYLFENGRLICVESINAPLDHVVARKLIADRTYLRPDQVVQPDFDPKKFMQKSTG